MRGAAGGAHRDLGDLIPLTPEEDFHFTAGPRMTGNVLLGESRVTRPRIRPDARTYRPRRRSIIIRSPSAAKARYGSAPDGARLRRGPATSSLVDMAQPNRTVLRARSGSTQLTAIILQRAMLAPRLAHPDSATATCCPRTTPMRGCSPVISQRSH